MEFALMQQPSHIQCSHREAPRLARLARHEVRHERLARVDGGLAGVVEQDDSHGQQQHAQLLGGRVLVRRRAQTLAHVEQQQRQHEDDGEDEDEGPPPPVPVNGI